MENRRLWIILLAIVLGISVVWALVEAFCGARERPETAPGQPQEAERCVAQVTPYPYVAGAVAGLALAFLIVSPRLARRSLDRANTLAARIVGWTLLTALLGFAILDLVGVGLFLLPIALLFLVLALWPADSGRWAATGGAALLLASVLLQAADVLYVPHKDSLADFEDHIVMNDIEFTVMTASACVILLAVALWPRWTSPILAVVGAAGPWVLLALPDHAAETTLFLLPGAFLATVGAGRLLVGRLQSRPAEAEEQPYSELEASRS